MRCGISTGIAIAVLFLPGFSAYAAGGYTPRVNYTLHCQGCHLEDGAGTAEKVPALKNQVGRFLGVAGGREYLVQVPGTSQSPMTDAETAAVLNWMLENFSPGQIPVDFVPYTTQEVARIRYEPLADVGAVRAGLLEAIE